MKRKRILIEGKKTPKLVFSTACVLKRGKRLSVIQKKLLSAHSQERS